MRHSLQCTDLLIGRALEGGNFYLGLRSFTQYPPPLGRGPKLCTQRRCRLVLSSDPFKMIPSRNIPPPPFSVGNGRNKKSGFMHSGSLHYCHGRCSCPLSFSLIPFLFFLSRLKTSKFPYGPHTCWLSFRRSCKTKIPSVLQTHAAISKANPQELKWLQHITKCGMRSILTANVTTKAHSWTILGKQGGLQ